jgi:hypothetical protein
MGAVSDEAGWMRREPGEVEAVDLRIDIPHSARMYDFWLGGKTNFPPDRALGEAFEQAIPGIKVMARENRRFLGRAVRYMAVEAGIRQFLDIGTGIPTEGNTHEVAQAAAADSRVVYVDNDPIVLAHARALMDSTAAGRTSYIQADLLEPEKILGDPVLTDTLDLTRPVGLTLVAVLMLLADEDDPWHKARVLMDALAPGSCVAITHPGWEFDPTAMAAVVAAAEQGQMTLVPRTREEVTRFFADWELVEPGVVPVTTWHPESQVPAATAYYWSGLARKR